MSEQATAGAEKPFELFELCAAAILGLGAIGASVAGYQEGLWGGSMTDAYSQAAATTTHAASIYNDELTSYIQDSQADVRAKELVWKAVDSEDEELRTRNFEMASWIYLSQLSEPGYAALALPPEVRQAYEGDGGDQVFTEDALEKALEVDLDETDAYEQALFAGSAAEFKKADEFLSAARSANTVGDQFSLSGVIQTVGLFFAGLSLVFKTRTRWGFLGIGTAVLVGGVGFMFSLPWA